MRPGNDRVVQHVMVQGLSSVFEIKLNGLYCIGKCVKGIINSFRNGNHLGVLEHSQRQEKRRIEDSLFLQISHRVKQERVLGLGAKLQTLHCVL
jgi:hypothetical protein